MIRLFETTTKRKTYSLDKRWEYVLDKENKGKDEKWYKNFPKNSNKIYIPSCLDNEFGNFGFEGTTWYKTEFITEKENAFITFGAVNNECEVYVDGKYIGYHYGAFCEFSFTLSGIGKGNHTLVVMVNNETNRINTVPLTRVDWHNYSGIIRSVEINEIDDIFIKHMSISYKLSDDFKSAILNAKITLESFKEIKDTITLYLNDEKLYCEDVVSDGETIVNIENIRIDNIKLWDIYEGNLYYIKAELNGDDLIDRIGFREIKTKNNKIYLNGKSIKIKGVNRHEEHYDWGFAMPFKLIKKDIDIIKNLGCNAIRGSHYPNSKATLDLLDEEGIMFWEEVPMWGFPKEAIEDELTQKRVLSMHKDMQKRDINRPCIVIWGMFNEIDTSCDEAQKFAQKVYKQIKEGDLSRLVSYASNVREEKEICYKYADIISLNFYFGWYSETKEYWTTFLNNVKEKMKSEGIGDRPIIISEFGAGGIFGYDSFEEVKWTEGTQSDYLDYTLKLFSDFDGVCGTYIWQYCDIRTSDFMSLNRPRSFNNKGIVNEHRQPKKSYFTVKDIYTSTDKYGN